jgi:anti-anti-sigma factor
MPLGADEIVRLPKVKEVGPSARFSERVHRRLRAQFVRRGVEGKAMNTINDEKFLTAPSRLVAETRAEFRNAAVSMIESTAREAKTIVLDLALTREVDATGLGTLVAIQSRAKQFGMTVKLVNVTEEVLALLALTELLHLFVVESA